MARIRSASVSKLAGRESTSELHFNAGVNVLWAENGGGKTTLLKVLNAALANNYESVKGLPFSEASVAFYSEDQERVIERILVRPSPDSDIQPDAGDEDEGLDLESLLVSTEGVQPTSDVREMDKDQLFEALRDKVREQEGWRSIPSDKDAQYQFRHQYLPTSRTVGANELNRFQRPGSRRGVSRPGLTTEEEHDDDFAHLIQQIWLKTYREQLVNVSRIQESGIADILNTVISGSKSSLQNSPSDDAHFDSEAAFQDVSSFFTSRNIKMESSKEGFQHNYQNDKLLRQVVEQIQKVESQAAAATEPARRIEQAIGNLFSGNKRLELGAKSIKIEIEGNSIPIKTLSSGEKQILYILLATLKAQDGVIIIDEPELSMHVQWQSQLISSMHLVNPNAQIIVATHSPEILASVSEEEIFAL